MIGSDRYFAGLRATAIRAMLAVTRAAPLAVAAIVLAASSCDSKPGGPGSRGASPAHDAPIARAAPPLPPPPGPSEDPENGTFTVDQAVAGLPGTGKLWARIVTDQGEIACELLPESAPFTVASFVGLARGVRAFLDLETGYWVKRPYFDGLAFYRVIPQFMIQGGDPRSRDYAHPALGTGGPGYSLPDEISTALRFDRAGRLAMANAGPGTAGSQFFITEAPSSDLDGKYTIFGQCGGASVVKAIARLPRNDKDKPNQPVRMKVEIFRK